MKCRPRWIGTAAGLLDGPDIHGYAPLGLAGHRESPAGLRDLTDRAFSRPPLVPGVASQPLGPVRDMLLVSAAVKGRLGMFLILPIRLRESLATT